MVAVAGMRNLTVAMQQEAHMVDALASRRD